MHVDADLECQNLQLSGYVIGNNVILIKSSRYFLWFSK